MREKQLFYDFRVGRLPIYTDHYLCFYWAFHVEKKLLSEIIGATSAPMLLCIDFILRWSCRTHGGQYTRYHMGIGPCQNRNLLILASNIGAEQLRDPKKLGPWPLDYMYFRGITWARKRLWPTSFSLILSSSLTEEIRRRKHFFRFFFLDGTPKAYPPSDKKQKQNFGLSRTTRTLSKIIFSIWCESFYWAKIWMA